MGSLKEYEEPIYLVSNLPIHEDPCDWYSLRFCIETLFSDQKSRGFHLQKSHLDDPDRLSQLMIAACPLAVNPKSCPQIAGYLPVISFTWLLYCEIIPGKLC